MLGVHWGSWIRVLSIKGCEVWFTTQNQAHTLHNLTSCSDHTPQISINHSCPFHWLWFAFSSYPNQISTSYTSSVYHWYIPYLNFSNRSRNVSPSWSEPTRNAEIKWYSNVSLISSTSTARVSRTLCASHCSYVRIFQVWAASRFAAEVGHRIPTG